MNVPAREAGQPASMLVLLLHWQISANAGLTGVVRTQGARLALPVGQQLGVAHRLKGWKVGFGALGLRGSSSL